MSCRRFVLFILYLFFGSFPQDGISSNAKNNGNAAGSDITLTVKNINEAVRSGALVKLYNSDYSILADTKTSDETGQVVFTGVSDGFYNFEVTYSPPTSSPVPDNTETWGTGQITVAGSSQSVSFTRNQPYISVGSTFSPSTLKTGNSTSGSFTVKNILAETTDSYVSVWLDRDKAGPWDFSVDLLSKTIEAGTTSAFPFSVSPNESGTYYYYAFVYSKVNGKSVITDQYSWTQAFVAENPEQAITNVQVNGTVYGPGSTVHVDVTAINSGSVATSCRAEIIFDRDKLAAFDYESGYQNTIALQPNEQTVFGFDWEVPVDAVPGTYYIAAKLQTLNDSGFLVSDSTNWETSFSIENTSITQIDWSGYIWNVKNGSGMGPGPNNWLGNSSAVWVDEDGNLHLKIRKSGTKWYCSEISTTLPSGYGEYTFQLMTDVEQMDQNIVLGLFTYESDTREIDIEFSRWSDPTHPIGVYVVQPTGADSHNNFSLNLPDVYSTHKFRWNASEIFFQSYSGNYPNIPDPDLLINQWTYTGSKIPPDGSERVILNFWLNKGLPPSDLKEAEVVIKSFSFKKVGNLTVQIQNSETGASGIVQLYNSDDVLIDTRQTDENGDAFFNLKPEGSNYYCRVFYQTDGSGSIAGSEYWGTLSDISIIGNETMTYNFQRDEPYFGNVKVFEGDTEVNGQTFEPGTELRIEQQLINPAPQTRNARSTLLIDINRNEPYNQQFTNPDYMLIPANEVITNSWTIAPSAEGSYFLSGKIETLLNESEQMTDSIGWPETPLFTIQHVNIAPTADAGAYQSVEEGALVTLDGSNSSDPENVFLSYVWTAPEEIVLSSNLASNPTFTAPEVKNDTTLNFSLIVNDGFMDSFPSTVQVLVSNVIKTSAQKSSKDGFSIYPNPTKGKVTIVGLPANVKSTIEVFTIEGKLIISRSCFSDTCTIDMSHQSAGNYLLKVNQHSVQIEKN